MKPKHAIWALWAYGGLLILASTRFSVASWIWGKWAWTWDYFQYSYRNGWGYPYRSDYSFTLVLTYLTALCWDSLRTVWQAGGWPAGGTLPP